MDYKTLLLIIDREEDEQVHQKLWDELRDAADALGEGELFRQCMMEHTRTLILGLPLDERHAFIASVSQSVN